MISKTGRMPTPQEFLACQTWFHQTLWPAGMANAYGCKHLSQLISFTDPLTKRTLAPRGRGDPKSTPFSSKKHLVLSLPNLFVEKRRRHGDAGSFSSQRPSPLSPIWPFLFKVGIPWILPWGVPASSSIFWDTLLSLHFLPRSQHCIFPDIGTADLWKLFLFA